MTNLFTTVSKVFSYSLIFLLKKSVCKSYWRLFQQKISVYLPYQNRNFNIMLANNFVKI